ncbi:MAG TPA: MAP_0585 family protein [Mycobacterium sp.]|nr:MAP_0585 family protein [Mycobacterium sp.]
MSRKRVVSAAAVAAGLGISALTLDPGFANSAPMDPPPCPNCHGGGGGGNPGSPGGAGSQAPQAPATTAPPATQSTAPPATQTTEAPATQSTEPQTTSPSAQTTSPSAETTSPSAETTSPSAQTTSPSAQTTAPSAQTTAPGASSTAPSGPTERQALNPPSTQPPHPAYIPPRGDIARGNAEIGGPIDASVGFSIPGRGAPLPPRERGYGWNDGPPPHHPPPNWYGPPPPGGWDGPPPPGGRNRPWDGPRDRDVVYAQSDFGPFAYNTFTVIPVFNWQYGGWGYWFFGVWIPLY